MRCTVQSRDNPVSYRTSPDSVLKNCDSSAAACWELFMKFDTLRNRCLEVFRIKWSEQEGILHNVDSTFLDIQLERLIIQNMRPKNLNSIKWFGKTRKILVKLRELVSTYRMRQFSDVYTLSETVCRMILIYISLQHSGFKSFNKEGKQRATKLAGSCATFDTTCYRHKTCGTCLWTQTFGIILHQKDFLFPPSQP